MTVHWTNGLVLFFYVFFQGYVVTNIITSIFVDTAISSTNLDREEVIEQKLKERDLMLEKLTEIFHEADEHGSGHITLNDFQEHLRNPRVRAYLRSVDLDVHEASNLF